MFFIYLNYNLIDLVVLTICYSCL